MAEAVGEALDPGDKATAKALSSAYKSAMLQLFCVPVAGDDGDASSHRLHVPTAIEPAQGWDAWAKDIIEMIGVCETAQALDQVRTRQASLLAALKREQAGLYAVVGEAFKLRSQQLADPPKPARRGPARRTVEEKADADLAPT